MSRTPETRSSLIARLSDVGDQDAWREFSAIYEPFIYGQARRYGLQDADAREQVQDVLVAVSRAIGRFAVDRERGRFRTWLYAIARNISLQHLAKLRVADRASGDPATQEAMARCPDPRSLGSRELDIDLKRHVFLYVSRAASHEFEENTWKSFWRTTVENHSIKAVADELGMSVGAVYIARSRVMARLRQRVQEITLDGIPEAAEMVERVARDADLGGPWREDTA